MPIIWYLEGVTAGLHGHACRWPHDRDKWKTKKDCAALQDLHKTNEWACKWQMEFNAKKCRSKEFVSSSSRIKGNYSLTNEITIMKATVANEVIISKRTNLRIIGHKSLPEKKMKNCTTWIETYGQPSPKHAPCYSLPACWVPGKKLITFMQGRSDRPVMRAICSVGVVIKTKERSH